MQAYSPDMDFELHHYETLDSTMNMARSLVESGSRGNHIVMADFQTSGKGRIEGRKWIGAPGYSLLMTLVIRIQERIPALPLRVGLAVLDVLANLTRTSRMPGYAIPLALKWPNDLLGISGEIARKMGGVLCELTGDAILAGIGINLGKNAYPIELSTVSTSIEEMCGLATLFTSRTERERLARDIADRVVFRLNDETWQKDYTSFLWANGSLISFLKGHPSRNDRLLGIVEGVDPEGSILVRDEKGSVTSYSSGEISNLN